MWESKEFNLFVPCFAVPSQPTDFKGEAKSETSILLSWIAPAQTGQENQITGYELTYRKRDDKEEVTFSWLETFWQPIMLNHIIVKYNSINVVSSCKSQIYLNTCWRIWFVGRGNLSIYYDTIYLHQKIALDHDVILIYFTELLSPTAYRNPIKYSKKKRVYFLRIKWLNLQWQQQLS